MTTSPSPPSPDAACCAECGTPLPAPGAHCAVCLLGLGCTADESGAEASALYRVLGDYELQEEISRGGMGVVYRATQRSLQRSVALKLMIGGELASAAARRMFQTEALAAAALHHPNIVPVFDTGESEMQPFIAMRLVPGRRNIAQWSAEHRAAGAWRLIAEKAALVARAVAHAHERGVLHRDLKPSNILWDAEAGPQVTDFGLAKLMDATGDHVTLTAQMLGSPGYMAPEQTGEGTEEITTATDVYGLGAVLYEMLSGLPPFTAKSAIETIRLVREGTLPPLRHAPRDLATVCLKCLSRSPQERYASAAAVAEELERFVSGKPVLARPVGSLVHLWRWARRNSVVAAASAFCVLLLVGGIVGVTWQWRKAERARMGEARALDLAMSNIVDLYTRSGLEAARDRQPAVAALWFAHASAAIRPEETQRLESSRTRWAAYQADAAEPVQAFGSPIGLTHSLLWNPRHPAIILGTGGPEGTAAVWDLASEKPWRPDLALRGTVWTAQGDGVVTLTAEDGTVKLFDYPSGALRATLPVTVETPCISVSPDGAWIGVGGDSAVLWHPRGNLQYFLPKTGGTITGMEFSRNGKYLAAWSETRMGLCLIPATGEKPPPQNQLSFIYPPLEMAGRRSETFVGPGDKFVTHDKDNQYIHETAGGGILETYPCAFIADTRSPLATVSPDGAYLGCFWSAIIRRSEGTLDFPAHKNMISTMAFSRDGSLLITGGADGAVRAWPLNEAASERFPKGLEIGAHQADITAVALSPDSRFAAVAQMRGGIVRIWRLPAPVPCRVLDGTGKSRARLSRDGSELVVAGTPALSGGRRTTRVFAVPSGEPLGPEIDVNGVLMDASLSPDGNQLWVLASTTPDRRRIFDSTLGTGTLQAWDYRNGRLLRAPLELPIEARALAWHPGGRKLGIMGGRRTVAEVDAETLTISYLRQGTLEDQLNTENADLRYSPDGMFLIAFGMGITSPVMWDAASGARVRPQGWDGRVIMDVDFRPGLAVSGSNEGGIEFLSLTDFTAAAPRIMEPDWVFVTRFSPDGDLLFAGGRSRVGHIWDWKRGGLHCPSLYHDNEIFGAAFIPGTRWLATSAKDHFTRFWDRDTGLPLREPVPHKASVLSIEVTPDAKTLITDSVDGGLITLYDIGALLPSPAVPAAEALLKAELSAGVEINRGGREPMSEAEWMEKWQKLKLRLTPPRW